MSNKDDSNKTAHIVVREELLDLQRMSGGMLNPFIVRNVFYRLIKRNSYVECYRSPMESARMVAETYCALANEFFLLNHNKKTAYRESFYVSTNRWEKYLLTEDERIWSIDFLQMFHFISCEKKPVPPENKPVTFYTISLNNLKLFKRILEEDNEK